MKMMTSKEQRKQVTYICYGDNDGFERCDDIIELRGSLDEEDEEKCQVKFRCQDPDEDDLYLKLFPESDMAVSFFRGWQTYTWNKPEILKQGRYGKRYFVLEKKLGGITLRRYLDEKQKVDDIEFVTIIKKAVIQIQKMHELGFIHADIKPSNLIIYNNEVYIIDYETVRRPSDGGPVDQVNSFRYTDPLFRNHGFVSDKTDMYSIGAIIKEVIEKNGHLSGDRSNKILKDIEKKCTSNEIEERYESTNDLIKALYEVQKMLLIEKCALELRTKDITLHTNVTDSEIIDSSKQKMGIKEDILYLLCNRNHRKMALTSEGIYTAQTNLLSRISPKRESVRYSEIMYIQDSGDYSCDFVVLKRKRDGRGYLTCRHMNCQGMYRKKIRELVFDIVRCREDKYTEKSLQQYYQAVVEEQMYSIASIEDGKVKVEIWKSIAYMDESLKDKTLVAKAMLALGEYYINRSKKNEKCGDADYERGLDYVKKAAGYGDEDAGQFCLQLNVK